VDKYSNRLVHEPEIITRGFLSAEDFLRISPSIRQRVRDIVNTSGIDDDKVIVESIRSFLYQETKRRPMVFVTLSRV